MASSSMCSLTVVILTQFSRRLEPDLWSYEHAIKDVGEIGRG